MKQFLKFNIIKISINPLAWGCLSSIATILLLEKSNQHYFLIALMLCLSLPLILAPRFISTKVKYIVILSIVLSITSFSISLFTFKNYYTKEQSPLDRYALIEDAITTKNSEQKYTHKIIAYDVDFAYRYMVNFVTQKPLSIPIGQLIIIPAQKNHYPHNTDFRNYLLKTEINEAIFLYQEPAIGFFEIKNPFLKIKQYILLARQQLLSYIQNILTPQAAYFFDLIFLGKTPNYNPLTDTIRQQFANWGILHIIARSGLHVLVLFILFGYFFCFVPINIRASIIMVPILFYTSISWFSISFARSLLSLLLTAYAATNKYITRPLDILITTAYIFIIYNPFTLFALDFQLSFGVTAILCVIYEIEQSKTLALPR